jgi:hypothetical protein
MCRATDFRHGNQTGAELTCRPGVIWTGLTVPRPPRPSILTILSPSRRWGTNACVLTVAKSKWPGSARPFRRNEFRDEWLGLRALPGSARDLRTIQADIPQGAIVEVRQLPNRGAITGPGSKRGNKRCNPHNSFPSVTKKSAESIFKNRPSRYLVCVVC